MTAHTAPLHHPAGRAAGALRAALPEALRERVQRAAELVRRQRREVSHRLRPTTMAAVDELLGGGLPCGGLVELVGRGSSGRLATLLQAAAAVTADGEAAALVDRGSQLDPQSAAALGVDLERLLWIRPTTLPEALTAAEMLVHTGFPLVAVDLGLPPVRGRAPAAAWLRLERAAAAHGAVVLVGSPYRLSGCAASAVIAAGRGRGRWIGAIGSQRLLAGLEAPLVLARRRGHRSEVRTITRLILPEAAFERPREDSRPTVANPHQEVSRVEVV